jgi:MtN3 and saliva related transmembrane protein
MNDAIGWSAAMVLLATLGRQVYTQWRDRSSQGVSRWLFIGQLASSSGFIAYSWLVGSWVFVVTNVLILLVAAVGQWVSHANQDQAAE